MKPIPSWNGSSDLKLIPEWFKARYVCALNSFFPHPHFPTLIILLFKFKVMSIQLIDFRVIDTCFYAPSDNSSRIILARKSQKKNKYFHESNSTRSISNYNFLVDCATSPLPRNNIHLVLKRLPFLPHAIRFWDNKQEKKHPWFMFALVMVGANGPAKIFPSHAFPVHQYYPTGPKKTNPNEAACRSAFYRVLKLSPPNLLKQDALAVTSSKKSLAHFSKHMNFPSMERPQSGGSSSSSTRELSSPMSEEQDDDMMFQRYRERPVSLSPVSSAGSDFMSSPWSEDGDEGMDIEDRSAQHHARATNYRQQQRRSVLFPLPTKSYAEMGYSEDVGIPLENIGADGMDAVQALLALREW